MPGARVPGVGYLSIIGLVAVASVFGAAATVISNVRTDLSAADRERVANVIKPTDNFAEPEKYERMQGGAATNRSAQGRDAFAAMAANIPFSEGEDFNLGEVLFEKLWVSAPSSTQSSDGLGPLFDARACSSCHVGNGRGLAPGGHADKGSLVFALLSTGEGAASYTDADPVYGRQLQTRAIQGHGAEGRVETAYEAFDVKLGDGSTVSMRRPVHTVSGLRYGPLGPQTSISPRIAPPMIGLGLIEQIADSDLFALADPHDEDGDGISGRVHLVPDPETGGTAVGRYGWKASHKSVRVQSASAFLTDIGLSTSLFPHPGGDCTHRQTVCTQAPHGAPRDSGGVEVSDQLLDLVSHFSSHIAVPARRHVSEPEVLRGKALFYAAGCTSCHQPKFVTLKDPDAGRNAFQLIWPYSDFLLHDMGDGLADQGDSPLAREWRTPPLWGIGLTRAVLGEENYLHDGRARTLEEAILWHGGEADAARDAYASMDLADRYALIRFLESL
ncbi:MAG: di-heme oxidoredictase family protein [Pseudomonadota bacterium]